MTDLNKKPAGQVSRDLDTMRIGLGAGAVVGAVVAGPVGAAVGAGVGAYVANKVNEKRDRDSSSSK